MLRFLNAGCAVLFGVLIWSNVWAQAESGDSTAAPADPTGSWKWDYTFNDNTAEFSLKLHWDGKELTGEYTAFDNTTEIEQAKLDQDAISFVARREFNGNEFIVEFEGKVQPDDIIGTVKVNRGDEPQEFDWHAKRTVEIDDVLGVWNLSLETPNGLVEPQLTISRKGDGLHGDYVSPFGEREAKDLTLKDGELSWTLESDEDDQFDFEIHYTGKPRGNTISGTNEYDFGGNTGTMEFTGKRTPPDENSADAAQPPAETAPAAAGAEQE